MTHCGSRPDSFSKDLRTWRVEELSRWLYMPNSQKLNTHSRHESENRAVSSSGSGSHDAAHDRIEPNWRLMKANVLMNYGRSIDVQLMRLKLGFSFPAAKWGR